MTDLVFPADFLWGTATAAHQVEGNNTQSDWWDWERRAGTPCVEPSGSACEHYTRYPEDIALLASLGFNTYRFSVEWARVEPADGEFDEAEIAHYRQMVETVRAAGVTPMLTLHHFTLPRWVGKVGGWTSSRTPALFERYARRVAETIGADVTWFCTINEPSVVSSGGYVGRWGFPPGTSDVREWRKAIAGLVEGHKRASRAIKEARPDAKVGPTLAMSEFAGNRGARPALLYGRAMNEDVFLEAAAENEFIGVQTYTRFQLFLPRIAAPVTRLALSIRPIEEFAVPLVLGARTKAEGTLAPKGARVTDMGWEFRPAAFAATIRRVARWYPDKEIVVTEHGIATEHDEERVEFITRGLVALHQVLDEGIKVRGYVHWSLMDNFEWAKGYRMKFGLVEVDRMTQERRVRPSGRFLGEIARAGRLAVPDVIPVAGTRAAAAP